MPENNASPTILRNTEAILALVEAEKIKAAAAAQSATQIALNDLKNRLHEAEMRATQLRAERDEARAQLAHKLSGSLDHVLKNALQELSLHVGIDLGHASDGESFYLFDLLQCPFYCQPCRGRLCTVGADYAKHDKRTALRL
jgi:hypothetical protein